MRLSDNSSAFIHPDFVPRSYSRPIRELSVVYAITTILIFLLTQYSNYVGGTLFAGLATVVLVLGIAAYTILRRQQHNDQMMATEFENLLFSAAAALGSSFCIFLRADGTIVYANDGARRMFTRINRDEVHALDGLLADSNVSKTDQDRLFSAIAKNHKENLVLALKDRDRNERNFILTLEPLQRPAGYFVLRGRDYYSDRKAVAQLGGKLSRTSSEKVALLLQQVPSPLYIISDTGMVEYANPALERLLGYNESEVSEGGMSLRKLVYHADGYETGEFEPKDFEGNVLLSCRNGSLAKAHLTQFVYHDEHNRPAGCCGILYT